MLAMDAGSSDDASVPSMPSTAIAADPPPGHAGAAATEAIGSTCTGATSGATACSGQRRVVAAYAPASAANTPTG